MADAGRSIESLPSHIRQSIRQDRNRMPSPTDSRPQDIAEEPDSYSSPAQSSTKSQGHGSIRSAGARRATHSSSGEKGREKDLKSQSMSSKPNTPPESATQLPIQSNVSSSTPRPYSAKGYAPPPISSSNTQAHDASGRLPPLRNLSSMIGKPSPFIPPIQPSKLNTSLRSPRGSSTTGPQLPDPATAPDVLPAPASGMYWSLAPTSGAPHTPLRAHTSTLIGSNIYIFGGCDARSCFNELYVLDADSFTWSSPLVHGESPVPLRAMTCTAVGKKLVIFGGGDGPAYYNDVYVLDTVNFRWAKPRVAGAPPSKRRAHTACFYRNGVYIFGGGDGVRALNDVWRLDVADVTKMRWELVSAATTTPDPKHDLVATNASETKPKARGYHTANIVASKLIIFGGSDGGECFRDVWIFDIELQSWKCASIPVSYPRLSHTATVVGSYLFVIGGHDGVEYSNEVLLLNLVTMQWDRRKIYGVPMSGRGYHGAVLHDSRLFVTGGFDGVTVFGDVFLLELAVHAYYSQISHFTIEV